MAKQSLLLLIVLALGCGTKDESVAKQVGNQVGETVTDFARGVGKGIDKRMEVVVELSDTLTRAGMTSTVAKRTGIDHPNEKSKGICVYLITKDELKGPFVAKAFNAEGKEVGRAQVEADFSADDAKYLTFTFDHEMDTELVTKYVIEKGKSKTKPAEASKPQ